MTNTVESHLYVESKIKNKKVRRYGEQQIGGGKWMKGVKRYKLPLLK